MKTFKSGKNFKIGFNCVIEEDVEIGNDVTIGHFVMLRNGTRIGDRVNISDYCCSTGVCYIGNDVNIRTRSTISKGVIVEDRAFIGAGVMTSHTKNIYHMRPMMPKRQLITRISMGAVIGSSCNLRAGVTVGPSVVVGYDSSVYFGNPAKKVGPLPPEMVVEAPEGWEPHKFSEELLKKYLPHCSA
jgi:UDP-2-acetamido-3-amino-2,3-dideoxy-glucuronate N-acetyltransferase